MNSFKKNSISYDYETAGEQLFLARKKQNLKLKKVSKKINISVEYLKFLEVGNFNKLPEGIYREKILKKYSSFLGLDQDKIAETFTKERNINSFYDKKIPNLNKIKSHNFFIFPTLIKNILVVFVILICFSYLAFCLNNVISPPRLVINSPENNNLILDKKQIIISGETNPEASVYINNKNILKDNLGNFEENINLKQGINTIIISAQKKYSKQKTIEKQIMVE